MTPHSALRIPHWAVVPHPVFALLLLAVIFLLRIFYAGYVWADEGLWFTAAEHLLRGKALYSEIWFDKPPAVAWIYAALFAVTGPSLLAVRLFTILYATAVALAVWRLGARFWGEPEGRLAALLYAIYNATYIHSQVQPMAVDHLTLLPYLCAGFFFLRGRPVARPPQAGGPQEAPGGRDARATVGGAFWSGLLAGVAFSINPKSAALFLFFALTELVSRREAVLRRWAWMLAGFAAACLPWALYLRSGDKWEHYLRDFWGWGISYVTVYSPVEVVLTGLRRTLNYAGFHFSLFLGLALLLVCFPRGKPTPEREASHAVWLWLGCSFLGVAAGGRFFPRYYYQVLPFLCLLAARGYMLARQATQTGDPAAFRLPTARASGLAGARLPSAFARVWPVLFWAGIAFALVRFHTRGAVHAYELLTGRQTAYMAAWSDPAMDRDSRLIAPRVRGSLFVWGYRPEIYFYCGCPPASKFLSSQPLTGVPADIHLREARSVAPEQAAENRRVLLRELEATSPEYIVDGLGPYNPALAIEAYPELRTFLEKHYTRREEVGHGVIYARNRG